MTTAVSLIKYIDTYYDGSQREFAKAQGIEPPQVTQWINKNFIVVEHVLYSARRELKEIKRLSSD